MRRNAHKGFTLLELLVVVIIIGVLAAVALPQFGKATERAKQSEALSILGAMRTAEFLYYQEHDSFTTDSAKLSVDVPGDASTEHYFKYEIPTGGANLTVRATRKKTGGKTPAYTTDYTIDLDKSGNITKGAGAP
ncbi:MAG: type II secretion system protein [Candidatus Omnitrophica bacterium]|nr:type II secretion system protein [Candidatus Omnitrophota bacterium]